MGTDLERQVKGSRQMMGSTRFWEIDVLRAVAIVLMVLFHGAYDLNAFAGIDVDIQGTFWFTVGKASALMFIFVSGLSSGLSRNPVRRGLKVLLYGLVITLATFIFMRTEYVRFGILHFLGVAMLLVPIFRKLPSVVLWILAGISAGMGFWLKTILVKTWLLLPFGVMYEGFSTIDYYPPFPYLAVTLIGFLTYRHFYAGRETSLFSFRIDYRLLRTLSQNSLKIYLGHQPIIVLVIYTVKYLMGSH